MRSIRFQFQPKFCSRQSFIADWDHAEANRLLAAAPLRANAAPAVDGTAPEIQVADLKKHVEALASEEMAGRLTGEAGEMLATHELTLDDTDHVICHQPNLRILDAVQEQLGIPQHKFAVTVDRLGNMASASTPVTLAMFWPDIQPGQRVLVLTYGSGATWGAALYRKPEEVNRPC